VTMWTGREGSVGIPIRLRAGRARNQGSIPCRKKTFPLLQCRLVMRLPSLLSNRHLELFPRDKVAEA
jgi:hypothetical protein